MLTESLRANIANIGVAKLFDREVTMQRTRPNQSKDMPIPSQQVVLASTALLIQWNLQIKDTLGLGFCPFKRGCPLFRGYKCIVGIQKQAFGTTKSVL